MPRDSGSSGEARWHASPRFFAACSTKDQEAIASIVATLRLSSSPVFLEQDFAEPQRKFAASIQRAIEVSPKFVLFWSADAISETNVGQQWKMALGMGKQMLPVKLDDTPLPQDLAACRSLDFTALAAESLDDQDDLLSEYALTPETREFWYRLRGEGSTSGPASDFFEAWIHIAFAVASVTVAWGVLKRPSPAWISLAVGLAIGIVFGPLLAHEVARYRARREMDRWLLATLRLYHDPTAERLRQADDRRSLSPLEAAALLHEQLRP